MEKTMAKETARTARLAHGFPVDSVSDQSRQPKLGLTEQARKPTSQQLCHPERALGLPLPMLRSMQKKPAMSTKRPTRKPVLLGYEPQETKQMP
jgi:hypothetical protein